MKLSIYENFPNDAKEIRKAVFIEKQGFQNEIVASYPFGYDKK